MPVIINDDNQVTQVSSTGKQKTAKKTKSAYSPMFFNSILTGRGGTSRGLLNGYVDPKNHKGGYKNMVDANLEAKTSHNGNNTIYSVPFFMINPSAWSDYIKVYERPDMSALTEIAKKGNDTIYLEMPIHAVQINETKTQNYINNIATGSPVTTREFSACFHLFLYSVKDPANNEHTQVNTIADLANRGNTFQQDIIYDVFSAFKNVNNELTRRGYTVDKTAMMDFVANYSIYVAICQAAERWSTKTDYYMADVFAKNLQSLGNNYSRWNDPYLGRFGLAEALTRLEKYSVPLNLFQSMYTKFQQYIAPDILTNICKSNLNLMLSDTLYHMDQNRNNLEYCPNNNTTVINNAPIPYSSEQKDAITSTSPLTLVQSGAGTGKSTIILGRIEHMIANGIDPHDILVLSFTNNAANHILEKNPNVNSMTIDRMMRLIYAENYPTHQLSSIPTIINSLEIYYPRTTTPSAKKSFIDEFTLKLRRLFHDLEYTQAMNFIEEHVDEVIDALDTIEQTSLELQSIICYLKMGTLVEPPETQAKHLIIDEVQDNSISQFVYSIKYTDRHCCSLYIVGDCSQTLYEFRASNPRALNVLEGSGVFATYKLQTNYRSNQEILDFANIGLSDIEANQYAKIQLRANSLKPVTYQSFTDAVKFHYEQMPNKSANTWDSIYAKCVIVTKKYIDDKLAKGEQVTFLARTRRAIYAVKNHLEKLYPTVPVIDPATGQQAVDANGNPITKPCEIALLIPNKQYDNTIFSKFIAQYWNQIQYAPPTTILTTIHREMKTNAINLAYRKNNIQTINAMIDNTIDAFKDKYGSRIVAMESEVNARILTTAQMLNEIKKYMISFEIERNGIAQAVMSSLNNEAKTAEKVANANFIMSTVHSAKGLEFDNVIVLYDSESESKMDEATKRMYYVALTRAKKTEYVYAYDTLARPKIGRDYETIVAGLKAAQTAAGNGTVDDDIEDDDTEDTSELEALLAMDPNPAKNGYDDESGDETDDDDV